MMSPKKFLLSRDDLTHQRGYWLVATILKQSGFEVILGGVQVPKEIAETAIQEDVDMIGYHIMQGSPKILVPLLLDEMKEKGLENIPVVIGGIIPDKDEKIVRDAGVSEVFQPLTPMNTITERIKEIAGI